MCVIAVCVPLLHNVLTRSPKVQFTSVPILSVHMLNRTLLINYPNQPLYVNNTLINATKVQSTPVPVLTIHTADLGKLQAIKTPPGISGGALSHTR